MYNASRVADKPHTQQNSGYVPALLEWMHPSSIDMFVVAADVNPTHASNHGEY